MKLIEVETDSNSISIIELFRLENEKYKNILALMANKDVSNIGYISRVEAGAKIKWHDDKNKSLSIEIQTTNYLNFLNHLNDLFN